uniref:Uncharacterized protein n=1 Tax=Anopheles melas TaxID=34690 RepID=A0A182THV0_9DIPT
MANQSSLGRGPTRYCTKRMEEHNCVDQSFGPSNRMRRADVTTQHHLETALSGRFSALLAESAGEFAAIVREHAFFNSHHFGGGSNGPRERMVIRLLSNNFPSILIVCYRLPLAIYIMWYFSAIQQTEKPTYGT